ncbi:MAG: ABC transporter permease [Ignavibacteria bacterium]|nr:ABC transporter permease [Ignavibacteria bacterium]
MNTSKITEIKSNNKFSNYWKEIWDYKELFFFLAWRDILVRYKQTFFGIAWSIIRPLITIVVFSVIFGKVASLPSDGIPYPILVIAGTLPWQLFSTSLSEASNSLISNSNMITKVYFPRLAIPLSTIVVSIIDFAISLVILICVMIYYAYIPSWQILTLPIFILIAILASLGGGIWFSALNVKYRDFKFVIPFIVQFGLFVSPVGFSSSLVPGKWKLIYSLNPMVGVIDGFRWAITGKESSLFAEGFMVSLIIVLIIFFSGIWYFRKTEKTFADFI